MTNKLNDIDVTNRKDGTKSSTINANQIGSKIEERKQRLAEYRKEASRLSAMANKRINRLEKNNLTDSPAYQSYIQGGGGKFGVRGKSHNELQAEVARLNRFLESGTSTVRGVNTYLKEVATNTGMKYKNLKELQQKAPKFFELSNKVEEYLRTVEDMASAIGYQKIWEAVNVYVQTNKVDLAESGADIDSMIEAISGAITEYEKPENLLLKDAFLVEGNDVSPSMWYTLKKKE